MGIAVGWDTVRDNAAPFDPIKTLQAKSYFFPDGNRDNAVIQGVALKAARPRFNLAFRKVVNRMQYPKISEK
jgi:hypothetical protein